MENRKLPQQPVHDETSVQLKGRDFEPLEVTDKPKIDNPPQAFDCKVDHSDASRNGQQD